MVSFTSQDTYCSNTTQGGYEALCVMEASLRELKRDNPTLEKLDALIGDAGSGYKSNQSIIGMRYAKKHTGISVGHWHFNASGEGKRNDTDGHNNYVKMHRKAAMRAGHPFGCTTPEREVQAANYKGGLPGTSSRPLLGSEIYGGERRGGGERLIF